ncbi:uncharacterized protein K452DRAFT_312788 [Aplosporella prunicola CBS 121167]|uniref:t-SNARE coiled-coil homology domain-containing protein n=1 Tax=Aplosporella prunicola CBS 121167 TaxID=1176127 RepID=A0A6A6AZ01_9PEZI|nr:uncharacterized protein K452DRAFT_312788 [Aplosporella prunicola CBS 121167]KAF2136866.1 hypothetical protein K452DRAFT_312788 [Aplosporella prunicola CBS 121167]
MVAAAVCVQDRTEEFRSILHQAQRRLASNKVGAQRQSLLTASQRAEAGNGNGAPTRGQRSEFARKAADIGRGISGAMAKLERLAQLARRKTLFDDRPVEIAELTYVIKQDLAQLNGSIKQLQGMSAAQHPRQQQVDQEGEHNKNVLLLLQGRVADVGLSFKEVLELRTKNIQASKSRTENFVSSVSASAQQHPALAEPGRSDSPLYQPPQRGRSPNPPTYTNAAQQDLLTLEPDGSGSSALMGGSRGGHMSDQQLLMMEEAQPTNTYINQRGEAIVAIEQTISELGGIFGQLAQMVSEQSEMIQRIDANTEDVVDNVQGAQRELMKYWGRMSGNRWLVAKMFGVLMIFFLLWVLIAG